MRQTIVRKTRSVCPVCIRDIDADIIEENNKIYMIKGCKEHGKFRVFLSGDAKYYKALNKLDLTIKLPNLYIDSLALLFLTSKCNLNCPICYTKTSKKNKGPEEPKLEEIKKILKEFKNTEIALFGGEPTLRGDLIKIVKEIIKSGNIPLLVTNGIRISDFEYLKKLKNAGIKMVLLQFDGFSDEAYKKIRGKSLLDIKKKALENLKKLGMSTSLEVAVCKGINDKELGKILDYASDNDFIKQICFRSYGFLGTKKINYEKMPTIDEIIDILEKETNGKITKEDILRFQKLIYSMKEIFGFIPVDLCLYAQNYMLIRDKGKLKAISDIFNTKKIGKSLDRYILSLIHI